MIRLLIADDERMEREALADIVMRRFEHEVTVEMAENGRKAADTAVLWGADLILMDIEMPGMNGLEMCKKIRETTLEKVPYMLVVGDRDMEAGTVSVRTRTGEDLGAMTVADFTAMLHEVVDQKLKK